VWICCAVAAVAVVARPAAAEADAERGTSNPSSEVVPEFDAYIKLSGQARLFLLADVARLSPDDVTNGEVGIHLDYTLKPILRAQLREADWARDRYLWVRVGYRRLGNLEGNAGGASENRLLLEGTGRFELPHEVWIVNRLRVDLRDVEGLHSTRYRYRIGAEKEFSTAAGTVFLPYAQAEWFYDTRFDAWSRQRYQLGVEIELNESWRIEPYYALDKDKVPTAESVSRLGLVLKYYQ
jgi:hypothetical protein